MEKWRRFFQTYRIIEIKDDNDLLFQVGTTVEGKPISKQQHSEIVNSITKGLELNSKDNVLDLCCGNGIITNDISRLVNKVIGIDGSESYITNARKLKSNHNIIYRCDDILNFKEYTEGENINKILFYASLAYFSKDELVTILSNLKKSKTEKIYIGSILDKNKKHKFFNTFRRRIHYLFNYLILRNDLGLGKWWSKREIIKIAVSQGFNIEILNQNPILHTAHYRFDALLINKN
jgi:SAM-dependent methyltransferase